MTLSTYLPLVSSVNMRAEKQDDLVRIDRGRGGRCTFQLAAAPADDIARAMKRALEQDPAAFEAHIPHLMERIKGRQPITLGDTAQLFRIKPQLHGLSNISERTFGVLEPLVRDAQQNLILRTTYFRSSRGDAA